MRLCFAVETTTDVRLLEGLAEWSELRVLVRDFADRSAISQPPSIDISVVSLAANRIAYSIRLLYYLIVNRRSYDFVLVQGYGLAACAANLGSRITKVPTAMLVCSPQEDYYRCRKLDPTAKRPFHAYGMVGISLLAIINSFVGRNYIVLSKYLGDTVRRRSDKPTIVVCPVYGVDTREFHPVQTAEGGELRTALDLPLEGSLIFFSSRIAPEKDVDTLLKAFALLLKEGRDIWLVNASGGFLNLLDSARTWHVEERLVARPAVDPRQDLARYYQVADICVQASRAEGLGFSPLEALSCGTPVVAASVGGLRETIIDGETGWTYPPGDAPSLARALACALDNRNDASSRASNGRALVLQRYDRSLVFAQMNEVLRELGNQSGRHW